MMRKYVVQGVELNNGVKLTRINQMKSKTEKELNQYILLVMKWLNDKDSVTQEELNANKKAANTVNIAYTDTDYATYAAYLAADDGDNDDVVERCVNKYFDQTHEDRQDYIDALSVDDTKEGKSMGVNWSEIKEVYTQAMCDNGELPSVGMECLVKLHHKNNSYFQKGYVNGYSQDKKWLIFTDFLGNIQSHNINNGIYEFKPLAPPIQPEDGKAYQFDLSGTTKQGCYSHEHRGIYCLMSFYGLEMCTNIKPLTVEGE